MVKKCDVVGCDNKYKKTLSLNKASSALAEENLEVVTRRRSSKFHICREHYRRIKKRLKKKRKLERLRW